jgi:hypothetical protein
MGTKIFLRLVVITVVALFVLTPPANARSKHCKGNAKLVSIPSETTLNLDDAPDHKMRLRAYVYEHSCNCEELGEFRQYSHAYQDILGGNGRSTGYYTSVLKGGDKLFGKFSGKSKTEMKKDGSWEMVFSGEWENTGGTGKSEKVKGKGTYSGKASPAGVSYEWEGDFEFPD